MPGRVPAEAARHMLLRMEMEVEMEIPRSSDHANPLQSFLLLSHFSLEPPPPSPPPPTTASLASSVKL